MSEEMNYETAIVVLEECRKDTQCFHLNNVKWAIELREKYALSSTGESQYTPEQWRGFVDKVLLYTESVKNSVKIIDELKAMTFI